MNLEQFRETPSIRDDFHKVAVPIDEFLQDHLISTVLGSEGTGETAEREIGAAKAIANIINLFRALDKNPLAGRKIEIKPLHRFAKTKEGGKPTNEKPKP